jgi:hypothetical protein
VKYLHPKDKLSLNRTMLETKEVVVVVVEKVDYIYFLFILFFVL